MQMPSFNIQSRFAFEARFEPLFKLACRLELDAELMYLEKDLRIETIAALRVLYGFTTYPDTSHSNLSSVGTYAEFLQNMDTQVRQNLRLDGVFEMVEKAFGVAKGPRSVFILINDMNAAHTLGVSRCLDQASHCDCFPLLLVVRARL